MVEVRTNNDPFFEPLEVPVLMPNKIETLISASTAVFNSHANGRSSLGQVRVGLGISATRPASASPTGRHFSPRVGWLTLASILLMLVGCAGGFQGEKPVVPTAPLIVSQPVSQSVSAGQDATFSVTTMGTGPFTYQWYKDGVPVSGATSSSYTTAPTVMGDSGAIYTVKVTGTAGAATSSPAKLTVRSAPPSISTPPASQTVFVGQTATFSVTAGGPGPFTYQWYANGAPVSGASAPTYEIIGTTISENGTVFTVAIMNAGGTVTSVGAALTVKLLPPTITTQPAPQSVSAGQTATFTVVATGTAPLVYQWFKNSAPIAGANSSVYITPVTTVGDSNSGFTVTVTNAAGTAASAAASLTVNAVAPSITSQPAGQGVSAGQTATFTVTAAGTGPLTYQWYKNGTPIGGATLSAYTTPPTSTADSGSIYTVVATNSVGSATSAGATLTVHPVAPVITAQPVAQVVSAGQTATFTVVATGTAPLTYQWFKGGSPISGATSAAYTTLLTALSDNGSVFTVTVTNAAGTATSAMATLTVNAVPPAITIEPVSQTVSVGSTATFTVAATGTAPLTYQWFKDGVAIVGATVSSYTTPSTALTDTGKIFTATITNSAGNVTSSGATLTVNAIGPSISTQPVNQTVSAGQTATFSVSASGTGPLAYQWLKGGSPISGATSSAYTTLATALSDSGSAYSVTVTNTAGNVTSSTATLTVHAVAPGITTQPASQTVTIGSTAMFNVVATGTAPLTYQWFKSGSPISGATSSTYTTPVAVLSDSGSAFTVTVTNTAGNVTSSIATLTVNAIAPSITTQPANQALTAGQSGTFSVTAAGTAPLTYQWYKNGILIIGGTSNNYTTPVTTIADNAASFTVVVTNSAGSTTSSGATLTVGAAPVITSFVPSSATPPYNTSVTLVPTFSNGSAVIGSAGVGSSDITASAVSGSAYSTPALTAGKTYTLTVTGAHGVVVSTTCAVTPTAVVVSSISPSNQIVAPGPLTFTATVTGGSTNSVTWSATGGSFSGNLWTSPTTVGTFTITARSVDNSTVFSTTMITVSLPVITGQPVSQNLCTGSGVTLSVTVQYAASYQWKLNGSPISGAIGASYTISSAAAPNAGMYTVTVTNGAGSVTSNAAQVVVGSTISLNPVGLSIKVNQTATFSVAATGLGPFSYQWYQIPSGGTTGAAISGATDSTYTTAAAVIGLNGAQYYATVTDACGSPLTSTSATLVVTTGSVPPTITIQPVGTTVAAGGTTASFSVVASGSPTLTYQWYRIPRGQTAGSLISGSTATTYTVPATLTLAANDQDNYYVIVANGSGQAVSQKATLVVGSGILIQVSNQPTDVYVNEGASATFSITATSSLPLTYQWYRASPGTSVFAAISGATGASYTQSTTALTDTGSTFYVVVSNGTTTSVTSGTAALFVGALSGVNNLCNSQWVALGNAIAQSGCTFQLTAASGSQHGEAVWPNLISTGNIQLSFTVAISNPSTPPADGFAVILGDPSLGATLTSEGATGSGLGAQGIPGFVVGFDTYLNTGDPPVPYLGVGRGETALWERPWFYTNSSIPALATHGITVTHAYVISIVQGQMTVTMDGSQVFSGSVTVPPVAYLYIAASTGGDWEQTVVSNVSATVSTP